MRSALKALASTLTGPQHHSRHVVQSRRGYKAIAPLCTGYKIKTDSCILWAASCCPYLNVCQRPHPGDGPRRRIRSCKKIFKTVAK